MLRWLGGLQGAVLWLGLLSGFALATEPTLPRAKAAAPARTPITVTFLNPGLSHELFWVSVSEFMQAAASDLGMQLTVHYAERDHTRMIDQARELLLHGPLPDYLVVVNETFAGPELLRLSQGSGVKVFMLFSTLTSEQRLHLGKARERFPEWIGSLVPDHVLAGRLMAQRLIAQARQAGWPPPIELLALSGDNTTPAALEREQGLREVLAVSPDVRLQQLAYGHWRRDDAYDKTIQMLRRFPKARLIWAANDQMGFGALAALQGTPGMHEPVLVSALNNSDEVFVARTQEQFAVLVGGHFAAGGAAMVMLYDHAQGHDFAQHGGAEQRHALFAEITPAMAKRLHGQLTPKGFAQVNFKALSMQHAEVGQAYDFSLQRLLP